MKRRIALVALCALMMAAWPAVPTHAGPAPVVVARFDPAKGQFPENLVFDHHGNIYLSMAASGQIVRLGPDGGQSVLATLRVGSGSANFLLGLAVDAGDNVYAALASHNVAGSDTQGIWKIGPDGSKQLFAALPAAGLPNQPLFDRSGNLLVSDSFLGTIWRISPSGAVSTWASDPSLQGDQKACGFPLPVGVNGMVFDPQGNLVVSNTSKALLLRFPVRPDGHAAGPPSVVASGCSSLDGADGITADTAGRVYVADNILSQVVRVDPGGGVTVLATASNGLDNPSGVTFGATPGQRTTLFITNFALFTVLLNLGTPQPSLVRFDVGATGTPVGAPPTATAKLTSWPGGTAGSFTVSFTSLNAGQGEVFFGPGPGCSGLVEVSTRDQTPGTSVHTVVVMGNDLPGSVGDNGLQPGRTYSYLVVTIFSGGVETDNNGGRCYSVTIPTS